MRYPVEPIRIAADIPILKAMEVMTKAGSASTLPGIAIVQDATGPLKGVVTDGDIRRALVHGKSLDSPVSEIMVQSPITVPDGLDSSDMLRVMFERVRKVGRIRDYKVDKLVLTDEGGRAVALVALIDLLRDRDLRTRTIAVIGMGYVGLTLGLSLCEAGFPVVGVERDPRLRDMLLSGRPHFYEPGLEPLLKFHLGRGTLSIQSDGARIPADVHVIAVGTPVGDDGKPRLDDLRESARIVSRSIEHGTLVLIRSTVPVGATRTIVLPELESGSGLQAGRDFHLAVTPERTIEGKALEECRTLPQIVGGLTPACTHLAARLFGEVTQAIFRVGSLEAAELTKLVNNTYRDVTFSFANELALICDHLGVDSHEVISAANEGYPRGRVPVASPGVGGVCLSKDPYIYALVAREAGLDTNLPLLGRRVNESMPEHVVKKVARFLERSGKTLASARLFLCGFAFKGEPETSDLRASPSLAFLELLRGQCPTILGYDSVVPADEIARLGVRFSKIEEGFRGADAVLILNNHRSYRDLDLPRLLPTMRAPALFFDGWSFFTRKEVERVPGITYANVSLGSA